MSILRHYNVWNWGTLKEVVFRKLSVRTHDLCHTYTRYKKDISINYSNIINSIKVTIIDSLKEIYTFIQQGFIYIVILLFVVFG